MKTDLLIQTTEMQRRWLSPANMRRNSADGTTTTTATTTTTTMWKRLSPKCDRATTIKRRRIQRLKESDASSSRRRLARQSRCRRLWGRWWRRHCVQIVAFAVVAVATVATYALEEHTDAGANLHAENVALHRYGAALCALVAAYALIAAAARAAAVLWERALVRRHLRFFVITHK
jgi:hypothetical protein